MASLAVGRVVLVRFPFSDLSQVKLRPAVVIADSGQGDWILCQVTSKSYADINAVALNDADFRSGSLKLASFARPGKLFTASVGLVESTVGDLCPEAIRKLITAVLALIGGNSRY